MENVKKELEALSIEARYERTRKLIQNEIENVSKELKNLNAMLMKPKDNVPRKITTEINVSASSFT